MLEKEPGEQCHAEWLDEPVDETRNDEPFRSLADAENRREIDLQHHRVDHQPDEHGDRNIDLAAAPELEATQIVDQTWCELSQANANDHAQCDPQRQVSLKHI